jgi:hypothetical protein
MLLVGTEVVKRVLEVESRAQHLGDGIPPCRNQMLDPFGYDLRANAALLKVLCKNEQVEDLLSQLCNL